MERVHVLREVRSEHGAVIWYGRIGGKAARSAPSVAPPDRRPARTVGMLVPSWGRPCGVAEYARGLVAGLRARGHTVHVLEGPYRRVEDWARCHGIEVVHLQCEYGLWDPALLGEEVSALLRRGFRVVATLHSLEAAPHNAILISSCLRLIVPSEAMRQAAISLGFPAERLTVIPMGVPPAAEDGGTPERARGRVGLPEGSLVLGSCGFFYPQKGFLEIVRAARLLDQVRPTRALLLAPVAPSPLSRQCHDAFRAAIAAEGLSAWVRVVPDYLPEEELVQRLRAADVLLFPYSELPVRQMSAAVRLGLASGRPVVVTDVFAFADLGEEVLKVPDGRPERLVEAVRAVTEDARLRARLLAAARRHAAANSWRQVAARHGELYDSL